MPIVSYILEEYRLVYMDHSGYITALDVAENYQRFLMMPGAHKVRLGLVDLRRIKGLRAYFDGMATVADIISSDSRDLGDPWQVALVSDDTGQYPLLLSYAERVQRDGAMRCKVLPTMQKAREWLGLPNSVLADMDRLRAEDIA